MLDNNVDPVCSCYGKGKFCVTDYGEINNNKNKTLNILQPLSWAAELLIKDTYKWHLSPSNFLYVTPFSAFVQLIGDPLKACYYAGNAHSHTS